jgi:hypothetical protein
MANQDQVDRKPRHSYAAEALKALPMSLGCQEQIRHYVKSACDELEFFAPYLLVGALLSYVLYGLAVWLLT